VDRVERLRAGEDLDVYIELEKKQVAQGQSGGAARAGDTWTEPETGMEFVWVSGGCYQMGNNDGDSDEKPVHEVCVDGFWMGRYEVTIDQYRKFLQATGDTDGVDWDDDDCPIRKGGSYSLTRNTFGRDGDQPMVEVSWYGARAFADWLSRKSGKDFRLPTEAEWEYAARSGGKRVKYPWGNSLGSGNANCDGCGSRWDDERTAPVGSFDPNDSGLYDMAGNVWEWCRDVYDSDAYSRHSRNNPVITSGGSRRVGRGGSWDFYPGLVRAADRFRFDPALTYNSLGFRLCLPQSGE
jgi:formylglycine-generating enzyme required for sulfatase activity